MVPVRIGILGAGNIAARWMRDAHVVQNARVTCVAARELERAQSFADRWHIPEAVAGYDALAQHPDVDAVYVATPHPFHLQHALLAMRAGKHVLCEKPIALNTAQLRTMIACATQHDVLLMEAMWTRLFPAVLEARRLVAEGAIGTLNAVQGSFAFRAQMDPTSRLFDPALGGGALLDLGCYPIAFALDMFGCAPDVVTGVAHIGQTGVDELESISLRFPGGGVAMLMSGVNTTAPVEVTLYGSEGSLRVPDFYHPDRLLLTRQGETRTVFEHPYEQEGFAYEVQHFAACIQQGLRQSPRMTHGDSLAVMDVMDRLRAQWGLRYPGE